MKYLPLCLMLCGAGCTTFNLEQLDQRAKDEAIRTKLTGTAWFSSAQNLSKISASQTEKNQKFGFDGVNQQGATNELATLLRVLQALRPAP